MKTEIELRKEWLLSYHDWYAQMKYFTKGEILPPKFYSYIDDYIGSHEWWKLRKAIIKKYQNIIIEIKNDEESFDLILKENIDDPYFDALVEHYNYRYTKDGLSYHIEPVYYEKVIDDEFEALSCSVGYIFIPKDKYVKPEDSSIYIRNEYDLYSKIHIYAIDGNIYFNRKYVNKFIKELYGSKYDLSNVIIMKVIFKNEYINLYYKIYREKNANDLRHIIVMTNIYSGNLRYISFKNEEECRKHYNKYNDNNIRDWYQIHYFFQGDPPEYYLPIQSKNPLFEKSPRSGYTYKYLDDYINSHKFDELKNKIILKFENNIKEIKNNYNNSFDLILKEYIDDPYFDALVEYYNFRYIKDGLTYHIEPIKYIDYSCEFEKLSCSIGYIFVLKEELDNILENGIFIRNKYGLFSKIHIYASYKHINCEIDNINKFIQNLYGSNYNLSNIGIIKVNLYNLDIQPYHEVNDPNQKHVILVENIDKENLKKIEIKK